MGCIKERDFCEEARVDPETFAMEVPVDPDKFSVSSVWRVCKVFEKRG